MTQSPGSDSPKTWARRPWPLTQPAVTLPELAISELVLILSRPQAIGLARLRTPPTWALSLPLTSTRPVKLPAGPVPLVLAEMAGWLLPALLIVKRPAG